MTAPVARPKRLHGVWRLALFGLIGVILVGGFTALGVWQIQRREWKIDLMARVAARLKAPPSAIAPAAQWPQLQVQDYEYLQVQTQGHWVPEKTVLTQATTVFGQGFWVLTPLQQQDGTVVLVNRGFIPQNQRSQWLTLRPSETPAPLVTVQGLLRQSESNGGFLRHNDPAAQKWYSRDIAAITSAQHLGPTAPFFLDAGLPDARIAVNSEVPPVDNGIWPRPGLTTVRFSNNHLVYALTWFALAAMVIVGGWLLARDALALTDRNKSAAP
jgi:surfeit locus 1 family protein